MRILILTSTVHGIASRCLPVLYRNKNIQIVKVILSHGVSPNRKKNLRRRINKILHIGFLGACNGIRIRNWYRDKEVDDIFTVCKSLNVEISESEFINCVHTRELFKESKADLGLSLGNGYIGKRVFSIPRYGMINIHTEVLPQFQGAKGVIWPIFEGLKETGYTIHQIDNHIDTGEILYQDIYPIVFYPTLRETVESNIRITWQKIPDAFSFVCENHTKLKEKAITQKKRKIYTTPNIWQYIRMVKNHKRFYQESQIEHHN